MEREILPVLKESTLDTNHFEKAKIKYMGMRRKDNIRHSQAHMRKQMQNTKVFYLGNKEVGVKVSLQN